MSKGMQQRLGIAQALIGRPPLLLLDEPTSALDPAGRRTVRTLLVELRRRGQAVLLNTHLLSEVEQVCDRVAIIDHGRLVAAGRPEELGRPRGVEVETAHGVRRFDAASRDEVPEIVERLVAEGERVYEVRLLRSTLEDAYLAALGTGGGGVSDVLVVAGQAVRESLRRRVFAVVVVLTLVLRRALRLGRERALRGRLGLQRQRGRPRRPRARGRDPARAWPCSGRSSSASCSPSS